MRWFFLICNVLASSFLSISKISKVRSKTDAKEMSEIPKCRARTKSDWSQTTAAAPIRPCKTRKNIDKKDKNFTSLTWPITIQARTANRRTVTPIVVDTRRWLYSIISSGVISDGKSCPLQSGQLVPHPAPESVFVTKAPPSKINIMPMDETTDSHLSVLIIYIASLYKLCCIIAKNKIFHYSD